jgi:hypothetical protein
MASRHYFEGSDLISILSAMPPDLFVRVSLPGKLPARLPPAHALQFARLGLCRGRGTSKRIASLHEVDRRNHQPADHTLWDGRAVLRFWPDQRSVHFLDDDDDAAAAASSSSSSGLDSYITDALEDWDDDE